MTRTTKDGKRECSARRAMQCKPAITVPLAASGSRYYDEIFKYYFEAAMSTMTVKGQVTIPKAVREHLGLVPGMEVEFQMESDGRVTVRRAGGGAPASRFAALRGSLDAPMSTDEILALTRGGDA
ncbi:AbrB/MazE/SpoVT family DNA-binding domain-containing protein [Burkholderia sp. Ac-20379]